MLHKALEVSVQYITIAFLMIYALLVTGKPPLLL